MLISSVQSYSVEAKDGLEQRFVRRVVRVLLVMFTIVSVCEWCWGMMKRLKGESGMMCGLG